MRILNFLIILVVGLAVAFAVGTQRFDAVGEFKPVLTAGSPGDLSVSYSEQRGTYLKSRGLVSISI